MDIICIRKYQSMVQSDKDNAELHWIKFYPDRLLGSMNFKRCDIREQSLYLAIFVRVRRDGEFCGKLCYPDGTPIAFRELIADMNPSERDRIDLWKRALNGLIKKTMVYLEPSGLPLPSLCPPSGDTSDTTTVLPLGDHCKNEHDDTQEVVASKDTEKSKSNINIKEKEKEKTISPSDIFDHWNKCGLLNHRKLSDKMKRAINGRLTEGYKPIEIIEAITTYAMVVNDKTGKYFWTYKNWSLDMFLQRGFERFRNREQALDSFLKDNKERELIRRNKAAAAQQKFNETRPCSKCQATGFDNSKPKERTLLDEAAVKVLSTKQKERLINEDGKYYLESYPICDTCKGARRIKINKETSHERK